ncbi:MAG: glutamine-hydrolyzing carbamoyl-phosphate synthase small subunit [Immundisolibacteraceae bacterium]|nr:glutamine-hydrolyzing carbamoyl-phosphate synthase small subunit [Immundisolibacteraceae bacterium]
MQQPAILALADGTIYTGISIGAAGQSVGEVVFNTALTGYQEILTDPSYRRQLVTLTYPHIGNVGWNLEDQESTQIHAAGLIIRDLPVKPRNWRSEVSLSDQLQAEGVVAISDIDTRALTRRLREGGAQNGCLYAGDDAHSDVAKQEAIAAAKQFAGLLGMDLAQEVTCDAETVWQGGSWQLGNGFQVSDESRFKVVAYDFGAKNNILRLLVDRGCEVIRVPATTPAATVLAMNPDGVFLSNGPGDPEPCDYAITAIGELLAKKIPMFGICLGHQLLALAAGATTEKMKFGHHGANHPVQDLATKAVAITSQNHGFTVSDQNLPEHLAVTHRSLFDQSIQGVRHLQAPAFGFQGHPEASPGPHDVAGLFDQFAELMAEFSSSVAGK